jgi:DNA invertase Pin-like site-specific DNA recombinase
MSPGNQQQKVTERHLQRKAYLYVRQSTLRQVLENQESAKRQYGLKRRAIALGWRDEQIVVIDSDMGQSGASATDRKGFQKLVSEVGLGQAGIVMGLEVSRLARNCSDWHRLLEICALSATLILDEDGLYDPGCFNDRLLLGLKGAMSEAELHVLKARLRGGILNKAKRAELKMPLPVGLVYDPDQRVVLDPDRQVRRSIEHFFAEFRRVGSAFGVVRAFRGEDLPFPRRGRAGSGELAWEQLTHSRALQTLHNPRYAGAFAFGRTRSWKDAQGRHRYETLPMDQWEVLIKDAHPGYIDWERHEENLRRLKENSKAFGIERKRRSPGDGPALLQGMVICGKCGGAMSLRYHRRHGREVPDYVCQKDTIEQGKSKACQFIPGESVDQAVGELILESLTPLNLESVFEVQKRLEERMQEIDRLRRQRVERARHETERARNRYMQVDPANRLVADSLEADWNEKLRLLGEAEETCRQQSQQDHNSLNEAQKQEILNLASDFPALWKDEHTSNQDRKRMAGLIVRDVTLIKEQTITVQVRFKGGASKVLQLPLPKRAWELRKTEARIVKEIDALLEHHTEAQIAASLNRRGWLSGGGKAFTVGIIAQLRRYHRLKSRFERLRDKGMLTVPEVAARIHCKPDAVKYWRQQGLLEGTRFNEKQEYLYQPPTAENIQIIKQRSRLTAHC